MSFRYIRARLLHRVAAGRALGMLLACLLSGGCAAPRLSSIKASEPLSIAVDMAINPAAPIQVTNESIGQDSATGLGTGASAGVVFGMFCGPLAILCIPAGALVGGTGGAIVGAVVGLTSGLSAEQLDQLNARLHAYAQSHDLREELRARMIDSARHRWSVTPDAAKAKVQVDLQSLHVGVVRGERVALKATVAVTVAGGITAFGRQDYKQFAYLGPLGHVSTWTDENQHHVDAAVRSAFQHIAAQIVADLAYE